MDNLDLERAKKLLQSAEHLVEKGDLAGAGGLAYQAFESAVIVKKLWAVRNVDFYGNEKIGEASREIKKEEIKDSVQEVRKILKALEEKETP